MLIIELLCVFLFKQIRANEVPYPFKINIEFFHNIIKN